MKVVLFVFCVALLGVLLVEGIRNSETEKRKQDVPKSGLNRLSCKDDIDTISGRDELMIKAETYFGTVGTYSLYCAQYAYWRSIEASTTPNVRVWYQLGRIDFLMADYNSALAKFNRQIQLWDDAIPNVYYMVGLTNGYLARTTKSASDWARAETGFQKFLELYPENPWARTDLAWVFFAQGKFDEMKPVLTDGLAFHSEHPWLLNMYGLALLNTGERERAHVYFLRARENAERLTPEMWGESYPGNDPASWPIGLNEMRKAIDHNIAISKYGGVGDSKE